MTPLRSLNPKDIIKLLTQLKEQTPEYPAQLLEARKAALLKQAATLKLQGKGQGGEGGSEGGSSGSGGAGGALSGGAAQGMLLQAIVGFSLITAMLLTAYNYREKIADILRDNDSVTEVEVVAGSQTPAGLSTPTPFETTITPVVSQSPTQILPTGTLPGLVGTPLVGGTPPVLKTPGGTKTNPGLHLGKTPGTPAAPGHGNPGNTHQPDKPDQPDRPDKPDRPEKPPKPPKNK